MHIFHVSNERPLANRFQPVLTDLMMLPTLSNMRNFVSIGRWSFCSAGAWKPSVPVESQVVVHNMHCANSAATLASDAFCPYFVAEFDIAMVKTWQLSK